MSYAQDMGYTPVSIQEILAALRDDLNTQFNLNYDDETFLGTNWYRFLYTAAQYMQKNEVATSEIFSKLQEFIKTTNERIQRPSVSYPGLIESFESKGFEISLKPMIEADAGKIHICANLDDTAPDYPTKRLEVCNLIKDFVAAGIVSIGTESETITLSNGQDFVFSFFLPTKLKTDLRLTINVSDNNLITVPSDEDIRDQILQNLKDRYRMGWDFEPQKYFTMNDAPYAGSILLEYKIEGGSWTSTIYQADFKDLLTFYIGDIQVIINN